MTADLTVQHAYDTASRCSRRWSETIVSWGSEPTPRRREAASLAKSLVVKRIQVHSWPENNTGINNTIAFSYGEEIGRRSTHRQLHWHIRVWETNISKKTNAVRMCWDSSICAYLQPSTHRQLLFVRLQWRLFQLHTTSHGLGLDIFIIIIVFFNDLVKCCLTVWFIYLFIILLFKHSIKDVGWDPFLPEPLDHFRVKYWCLSVEGRSLKRATYETSSNDRRKQYQ